MNWRAALLPSSIALLMQCSPAFAAANAEWQRATTLYNAHDYVSALGAFRKIEEKMPSDPSVHYMLGQCYKGLNNTKQAVVELQWVATNARDPRIKGGAATLLSQLTGGGGAVAPASVANRRSGDTLVLPPPLIPGAVSPYSIPPGGGNEAVARVAAGQAPTGVMQVRSAFAKAAPPAATVPPPPRDFVGDSAAATVSAAAQNGWAPCKAAGCLTFATPGWHHEQMEGFAASDQWMDCPKSDGSIQKYSQRHIGHTIKDGKDIGNCPTCNGTGWVRSK